MSISLAGRTDLNHVYRNEKNGTNLLEYANQKRHSGSFYDVEICAGNDRFPANRMVLSCFSTFFENMFNSEMKEKYQSSIEINCVDGNSMKNLIEFMYTGKIIINGENVCDLVAASDYLQIHDVKQFCFNFLTKALSPDNCLIVLGLAERFNNNPLKNRADEVIARNFETVSSATECKNFTKEEMRNVISKQDRSIVNEASVLTAILGWIKHDKGNRAGEFSELLKLVDLQKLPSSYFEVILKEKLVMQNHELCQLFFQAQNKVFGKTETDENIRMLSLGGSTTTTKVIEIFNWNGEPPLIFPGLPDGRKSGCSVVLRGSLYYVGGNIEHKDRDITTSSVWKMDLSAQPFKWERVKSMYQKRSMMAAAVFDGHLVVVGDQDPGECYSSVSNSWQDIPRLQHERYGNALVACKGGLYAIGGDDRYDDECLSSVECFSGDRKWKYLCPMQTPRRLLAAVCCDGFIYAIGGEDGESDDTMLKSVEKYDPSTDEWTYISDMNFHRSAGSACVLKGKIFVVGGVGVGNCIVQEIECYFPSLNTWKVVGKTTEKLCHHSLVAV